MAKTWKTGVRGLRGKVTDMSKEDAAAFFKDLAQKIDDNLLWGSTTAGYELFKKAHDALMDISRQIKEFKDEPEVPKNFTTLEVGASYKNRRGDIVKIIGTQQHDSYVFMGDSGAIFTRSGSYFNFDTSDYDLVEKVTGDVDLKIEITLNGKKYKLIEQK